jgi:adenylate kinase
MAHPYKSMLLFGAPGVGKGTQGKILACIPGLFHLATGDIFRSLDRESELGRKCYQYSARGELVPDELTIELWQDYVNTLVSKGRFSPQNEMMVLDGIPRSIGQAAALDKHIDVVRIIHLKCNDVDEMVSRMKRRARMENRHDDADEKVIRRRFEVYEEETAPVLSHYPPTLVADVDALGTPAEVLMRILKVIVPIYNDYYENPLSGTRRT